MNFALVALPLIDRLSAHLLRWADRCVLRSEGADLCLTSPLFTDHFSGTGARCAEKKFYPE